MDVTRFDTETIIEQKNQLAENIRELIQTFLDNNPDHDLIIKIDYKVHRTTLGEIRNTVVNIFIS